MEPKRLFDCVQYHLDNKPLPDMLAAKEGGKWRSYSTREVKELVDQLGGGLLNLGIGGGDMSEEGRDKVAVLSKNRPEWVVLDLAVQQIGAVLTPIYPTINVNELEFVLKDAQVKMVFVNDEETFHKVISIKDKLPALQEIFSFEHVTNARHWKEVLNAATPASIARIPGIADTHDISDNRVVKVVGGATSAADYIEVVAVQMNRMLLREVIAVNLTMIYCNSKTLTGPPMTPAGMVSSTLLLGLRP